MKGRLSTTDLFSTATLHQLTKEVNCTEPFPSVSIPRISINFDTQHSSK